MSENHYHIPIADYDYPLADNRIASHPCEPRDKSKLLIFRDNEISEAVFDRLPQLLDDNTFLIFNDTKVVRARIFFEKGTGAVIEAFCLEPLVICEDQTTDGRTEYRPEDVQLAFARRGRCFWRCFVGNSKRWKEGWLHKNIVVGSQSVTLSVQCVERGEGMFVLEFCWDEAFTFSEILETAGVMPLPPYIKRQASKQDEEDYQTIYAHLEGSVAAPTAGLHFTERTFADLKARNIDYDFITLHVGAGTFKPVTAEDVSQHVMHTEKVLLSKSFIEHLMRRCEDMVLCVGTTSVRTIESLYWYGVQIIENGGKYLPMQISQWQGINRTLSEQPLPTAKQALTAILQAMAAAELDFIRGETQIIIAKPYKYRIVRAMITNFHQPKSTLLLLVSAFIGNAWTDAYKYAAEHDFRFLSFGDCCLLYANRET
ncbi:MAG: S-adenosylmethionine:tRNA ribosyltransferase-isomerase [Bacteroidales bacterium]|jgi:S-adenosylmethionine:tRNA ribosyltransferase-isomerase|nr:S-adenosylmethionine:tRNA ribosyltransferase-isomerase [Bacteroidales bacterium]